MIGEHAGGLFASEAEGRQIGDQFSNSHRNRSLRLGEDTSKGCSLCLGLTSLIGFLAGVALLIGGVALHSQFPSLLASHIERKVTIEKGHATYEQLEQPSIDVFRDFYFFNLTNYQEFHDERGGVEPELEEIGPYSFMELRTKVLLETGNHSQVKYTQRKLFFYNEETSGEGLTDSDIICTLNIPLIVVINFVKDVEDSREFLLFLMNQTNPKLYVCEKAKDLLWGYSDEFIQKVYMSNLYPVDKVYLQINDSADDQKPSIINTGIPDIKLVGQFIRWNDHTKLDIWEGEANEIHGTEGLFFKPNLKEEDCLTLFVGDMMRSFDILFEGRVNHLGLNAFRYGIDNRTFLSAFSEQKNADYFSWCPDGMFNLGPTQFPSSFETFIVPMFGSKPHFLDGDPLLLESVIGLEPDREKHDTVIDVEPITGANINFHGRVQVIIQANRTEKHGPHDTIEITGNIKGYNDSGILYFPVIFIDEHATIDEDFKNYLEEKGLSSLHTLASVITAMVSILITIGVVLIFVGVLALVILLRNMKRTPNGERIPLIHRDFDIKKNF